MINDTIIMWEKIEGRFKFTILLIGWSWIHS